ncbi:hypothetical protein [Streptomyces sp. BBFR109]|uniref:hypothetical protein n=1 Tax=Streptomyces sp. BBFR109 TaxID=3448172 RepID=UPI003F76CFAA
MSREHSVRTVANTIASVALRFNMTGRQPSDLYHAMAEHLADAGLLQSPETAAELDRLRSRVDEVVQAYTFDTAALRKRVAELEAERHTTNEALSDAAETLRADRDRLAELEAMQGKALRRTVSWRLEVQEHGGWWDCGQSADSYPAAQDLLAREQAEKPEVGFRLICRTTTDTLPAEDVTPQVTKLRALLAGQRAAVEEPHDSPLHHDYRVGRDLPAGGDR